MSSHPTARAWVSLRAHKGQDPNLFAAAGVFTVGVAGPHLSSRAGTFQDLSCQAQ